MAFSTKASLLTQFGDFGRVLVSEDILRTGNEYIFTFEHGRIFEYRSDSWVEQNIRERIANFGQVISVKRPLFSNRYLITVIPTVDAPLSDWLNVFDVIWRDMGYGKASFLVAEEGRISTQPGGVIEIAKRTGEEILKPVTGTVGEAVATLVKPVFPYVLVLGGVALLVWLGGPKIAKVRR